MMRHRIGLGTAVNKHALDLIIDDPTIGTVCVLTPPWTHLNLVRRCAAAGKHVRLEKPIEATLERSSSSLRTAMPSA